MKPLSLIALMLLLLQTMGWGYSPTTYSASLPPASDRAVREVSVPQVVGGIPADILRVGGYAYVNIGSRRCNGVLVDPEWVLTAAFCVYANGNTVAASQMSVELGCYAKPNGNVCTSVGGSGLLYGTSAQRIGARSVYTPPQLTVVNGVPQPHYGVALIRLLSPARTGAGVTPLPLAVEGDSPTLETSPYVASFGDIGLFPATATRTASRTATMSRTATVPVKGTATMSRTRTVNLTRSATMSRTATMTQTATQTNEPLGIGTTQLRTASIRLVADDACTLPGFDGTTLWCADATAQGNDLCYGDTGAPLLSTVNGQTMVFGVSLPKTQFGASYNCKAGTQSAFVDVRAPAIRDWVTQTITAVSQRSVNTLLGGSAGFGDRMLDRSDNDMTQVDVSSIFPQGIRIGNSTSSVLSVNSNGVVALGDVKSLPAVLNLRTWRGAPVFAPFSADGDTSGSGYRPLVGSRGSGANRVWVAQQVSGRSVTITWDDVRPYVVTRPQYVGNTYQLQLRSEENGDVRVTFRYGVIQWTYGEKNCGTPCRAVQASHAQIGVVSGDGRDVQVLSGSGNESILRTLNSPYTLFIRDGRIGGFGLLPSERATYTASMTATATRTATVTPTHTPTHTATHTLVSSATHTVTNTTTSTFTNTVTNTPTPTATHTTTSTFTNTVTNTPTPTATHTATTTQVWTVTHTPTASTTSTPIAQGISDGLLLWAPLNGIRTTGSTLPVQANTIMGPVQYFDGVDDYHQMSANIANKSFTVAVWAKYESDASLSRGIVSIGSTIANNAVFYLGFRNTGQYICNFYEATLSYTEYTPPPQFDRSQWHHYACTFDNVTKNRSLYIDGTLVAVQNVPLGFVGDSDVYIGVTYKQSPGHAVYYKGGVRDLFIYDRVLSASELTRIQAITPNSVMLSEPHPASACRWVDKGGMVHEYEINQDLLTWDQAKAAAESRTRGGQKGYLATIMSAAENECLVQLVETQLGWTSGATGDGPWLGAKRVSPGGTFIWQGGPEKGAQLKSSVSGAPVSYDNWNTGEPNNATGIENALQIWYSDNTAWNDDGSEDLYKSIIEYTYPESHAISGVAYTDTNANNQLDSGDFLASNQTITLTADLAQPIDLVGGGNQFCARLDDGRATCWGRRGDAWRWDQQSAVPIEIDGWRDVRAISNGINTSCALLGNGTVSCLGKNSTGAVGDGTTTDRWMPVAVSGLSNVVALNSGAGYHHCAVLANTTVKCWGANESAQLGDGTYTRRTVPATVTGLSGATQVSVGERHTCARKSDGIVWCWGSNDVGQLADGGILESTTPRQIAGVSGVTALASGPQHVCVLRSDAQVACWGHPTGINGNRSGAVVTTPTVIANTTGSVSLSVGNEQSCVAKSDGTVWCWGHVFHGEAGWVASGTTTTRRSSAAQITSVSDIVQVALSANSGCGRRANGDMLCWGEANVGQLGDGTYQPRGIATNVRVTWQTNPYAARVAMLDGSWYYQCGILTDRRVACWGLEGYYRPANHYIKPEPEIVDGLRDIVDLYVNYYFSCALQRTGLVWCWGYNLPTTIMEDGTIAGSTVERSVPRRINTVTDVIALSKGRGQTCLAIRADWSAYCVSSTTVSPEWDTFKLVPGSMTNTGWVGAVVTSYIHACALAQLNGSVWCWGNNSYFAQYGNGVANTTNNVPVQVSGLSTIQQLSVASYSTCALATTGDVHCWGNAQEIGTDGSGQVSAGQGNAYSVPKMISGITNAKKLDIGDAKQCAVLQEGTVWCWGGRLYTVERSASIVPYQIPGITDAIDVSVTGYYDSGNVCVLKRGGDVLCWGIGTQGGLGNGQTTNRAIPRSINEPWQANVNQGCEWVDWQGQRHKYESLSGNWTWPQARDIVAARTWRGNNGYLATITSPEENRCVHQLFMKQETTAQWPGMLSGLYPRRWLGGSDADSEGTWKWMTGPEAGATFRIPSGLNPGYNSFQTISDACKPNCTSPTNWDYLQLMFPQGTYIQRNQWNDESGSDNEVGAIVEYTTGTGEQARSYTTTTDSQGNYSFAGLAPGVYTVQSTTHGTTSSQRVVLWPDQRDERVDFVNRSVTNGLRQTMTAQPTSTMTPTHTHTPTMTRTPVPPNVVSTVYTWNNTDNVTQRVTINQSNQIGVLVLHTADGRDYRIGIATFNGVNYTRPVGMPQANSTDRGQNYDLVYWNLSSLSAGTYDLYYDVTTGSPTGGGGFEFFVIQGVDPVNPVQTSAGYTSSSGGIPSINLITTRMNSLLFDFFFTASSSSTAGTGQTQLYQLGGSTYGGRAGVSYKIAAAIGTHNMTQSTSSGNHSYFAMAVNPQP